LKSSKRLHQRPAYTVDAYMESLTVTYGLHGG
jgi:hypothetical protein